MRRLSERLEPGKIIRVETLNGPLELTVIGEKGEGSYNRTYSAEDENGLRWVLKLPDGLTNPSPEEYQKSTKINYNSLKVLDGVFYRGAFTPVTCLL